MLYCMLEMLKTQRRNTQWGVHLLHLRLQHHRHSEPPKCLLYCLSHAEHRCVTIHAFSFVIKYYVYTLLRVTRCYDYTSHSLKTI